MYKAANAEDLFGDADDISSVSSHEDKERDEANIVCGFVLFQPNRSYRAMHARSTCKSY